MKEDCLVCFAIEHDVSQEILLDRFGAVAVWQDQARHDAEKHEQEMPA